MSKSRAKKHPVKFDPDRIEVAVVSDDNMRLEIRKANGSIPYDVPVYISINRVVSPIPHPNVEGKELMGLAGFTIELDCPAFDTTIETKIYRDPKLLAVVVGGKEVVRVK